MVKGVNYLDNYPVSNSGLKKEDIQSGFDKSKTVVTDNFDSNTTGKMVSGNTKDPSVMRNTLLVLPAVAAVDRFVDSSIGGKGTDGLLGKVASAGDKISHKLHLDKIFSAESKGKVSNFIKNNRFLKYFTNDYKAVPRNAMARSQTMTEKYAQEAASALSKLKGFEGTAKYFDDAAGFFKPETLSYFGLKDGAPAATKKLTQDMVDDLVKGIDKVMADGGIDKLPSRSILSSPVSLSTAKNKLKAASSGMGTTEIGKGLAKSTLKTKDIITYGGGLISLGFAANAIVQAVKATKEAPKGEKKSTFMHVLSENYIGIILFQPSINMLYKAGGNKYRGMTVDGRNALKELVTKTNADKTLTQEGYKIAKLQKDLLIRGVSKDKVASLSGKGLKEAKALAKNLKKDGAKLKFWEKPLKAIGKVLDTGLDSLKSPTTLGKVGGKVKGFAAGFGRFALILFVLQPLLQKPVTKLCHKLFGEPKTYLEKQKKQNEKSSSDNTAGDTSNQLNEKSGETNLVKLWTSQDLTNNENSQIGSSQRYIPNTNVYNEEQLFSDISYMNSYNKTPNKNNNVNRYIPSTEPVVIDDNEAELSARADEIIKSTDDILNNAKKYL